MKWQDHEEKFYGVKTILIQPTKIGLVVGKQQTPIHCTVLVLVSTPTEPNWLINSAVLHLKFHIQVGF